MSEYQKVEHYIRDLKGQRAELDHKIAVGEQWLRDQFDASDEELKGIVDLKNRIKPKT